jgi:hypothetical protein
MPQRSPAGNAPPAISDLVFVEFIGHLEPLLPRFLSAGKHRPERPISL